MRRSPAAAAPEERPPNLIPAGTGAASRAGRGWRYACGPILPAAPTMLTAEDRKGFHGLDERLAIENLLLGCKIVFDLTLRAAAR